MITFTYDHESKMSYAKISDEKIHMTVDAGFGVNFDIDANGKLVGVEIPA